MRNYEYNGYIKITYTQVSKWIKNNFINAFEKSKIEFVLKEQNKEIYIYDDFNGGFLFSAVFLGSFEEAQNFINKIVSSLENSEVEDYQFEWSEVDDEGNQIGSGYEINYKY